MFYSLKGNLYLRTMAKFHRKCSNRTKVKSLLVSPPTVFRWFKNVTQQKGAKNDFTKSLLK